jgi:hypothetical protein
MAAFLAQAAVRRTPVVLDGVVSGAAALLAEELAPGSRAWWVAGHRSTEPAHTLVLEQLDLTPLLELNMRLGEGSGATTAIPLITMAVRVLTDMATFADAGVSGPADGVAADARADASEVVAPAPSPGAVAAAEPQFLAPEDAEPAHATDAGTGTPEPERDTSPADADATPSGRTTAADTGPQGTSPADATPQSSDTTATEPGTPGTGPTPQSGDTTPAGTATPEAETTPRDATSADATPGGAAGSPERGAGATPAT